MGYSQDAMRFTGEGGWLEGFEIRPAQACDDLCFGVGGDGRRIELSNVFIARLGELAGEADAAGIYLRPPRDSAAAVDFQSVELVSPRSRGVSWGILIDGRESGEVSGSIRDSAVRAGRGERASYGLRTLATEGLALEGVVVDNELASTLASQSSGIAAIGVLALSVEGSALTGLNFSAASIETRAVDGAFGPTGEIESSSSGLKIGGNVLASELLSERAGCVGLLGTRGGTAAGRLQPRPALLSSALAGAAKGSCSRS